MPCNVYGTLTYLILMAALTNMANKFNRGGAHTFNKETRTEEQQKNPVALTHWNIKHLGLTNTVAPPEMLKVQMHSKFPLLAEA